MHDVIVVGGSFAGLAATLQLGRARRDVLVIDGGSRRNRFAAHSHGFLGQDGVAPGDIVAKGRAEVLAYPSVQWLDAQVGSARVIDGGFAVQVDGQEHRARRLLLATGVVDELPAIEGLAERWGKTVFHCPYCDGFELNRGAIGVIAAGEHAAHFASLVNEWSSGTTFFPVAGSQPTAEQLAELARRDIQVERTGIARVVGDASSLEVVLEDGRHLAFRGVFVTTRLRPSSLGVDLGCALEQSPVGTYFKTDMTKETSIPGVFACGDGALMMSSVSFAVADGAMAGVGVHRSLVFGAHSP